MSGVGPLWFSIGFICIQYQYFFPLVAHLGGSVWVWIKSNLFCEVHWGPNSFYDHMAGQNEFDPQWTYIDCSLFKPPNSKLSKHGRCCMQNNQLLTKSHDELWITLLCSYCTVFETIEPCFPCFLLLSGSDSNFISIIDDGSFVFAVHQCHLGVLGSLPFKSNPEIPATR